MNAEQILAIRFDCDDLGGTVSIRDYLCDLLEAIWTEGESFSGKRPFGNSGWQSDIYRALVLGGVIEGALGDVDGYLCSCDDVAGDAAIRACIQALRAQS